MALHAYTRFASDDLGAWAGGKQLSLHAEHDLRRPTKFAERVVGSSVLRLLQEGDTLVAGTLGDLCDFPSDALKLKRVLAGRGVHLVTLDGEALEAVAGAFAWIETELGRVKTELSQIQEIADQRVQAARAEIMKQMLDVYGPPESWSAGMPKGAGDVTKPMAAGTMGDALRKRREAMGLSQSQLAEQSGVSQTTISRSESNKLPAPERLLAFLFDEGDTQ